MDVTTVIDRSINNLHPKTIGAFFGLQEALVSAHKAGKTKLLFQLFEGYRHPARQKALITQGTTKATSFQSAHQFGVAADFVPRDKAGNWTWTVSPDDVAVLHALAVDAGLRAPITWDPLHIEHPLWDRFRRVTL